MADELLPAFGGPQNGKKVKLRHDQRRLILSSYAERARENRERELERRRDELRRQADELRNQMHRERVNENNRREHERIRANQFPSRR